MAEKINFQKNFLLCFSDETYRIKSGLWVNTPGHQCSCYFWRVMKLFSATLGNSGKFNLTNTLEESVKILEWVTLQEHT